MAPRPATPIFTMLLLLYALALLVLAAAKDLVLQPVKRGSSQVALIMVQGPGITADQYRPLSIALQQASDYSLWVGIPEFLADVPDPLVLPKAIDRVLRSMKDAGMDTDKIFFAGHSLGGIILQDYVYINPSNVTGQILMGSFLLRKYHNKTYPVPTFTLGGELDGLARVTRIMEAHYHSSNLYDKFPVVIVEGMSHAQFASGDPPALVRERDLKPEVSLDQAHNITAQLTAIFLSSQLGNSSGEPVMSKYVDLTTAFLQPLLKAYELEGFYSFKPPCGPCYRNSAPDCTAGSPWTSRAQTIIGGLEEGHIVDKDMFCPASNIFPDPLPKIVNNCTTYNSSCVLSTMSATENVYEAFDRYDTAFYATSSREIRSKMSSRQAIFEAAGKGKFDFNSTDGSPLCKLINQAAYDWAVKSCGAKTLTRFQRLGQAMIMGDDTGPYNIFPEWIIKSLEYKQMNDASGRKVVEISSPTLRTPVDFYIPFSAAFHFCKLLSPARVMEWLYVDGLRMYDSLGNSATF